MRKKIALVTGTAVIALFAAGCSDKPTPAANPAPVSSPTTEAAATPPAPAETGTPTGAGTPTKTRTGTAGKPAEPTSDPGDGGNWFSALAACPNKGQQAEVQKL